MVSGNFILMILVEGKRRKRPQLPNTQAQFLALLLPTGTALPAAKGLAQFITMPKPSVCGHHFLSSPPFYLHMVHELQGIWNHWEFFLY